MTNFLNFELWTLTLEKYSFLKKPTNNNKNNHKKLKIGLAVTTLVVIILTAATAIPAYLAYRDAMALKAAFKDFKDGVLLQDLSHMERALGAADTELSRMQNHTAPLNWTRVIPFVGNYKADLDRVLRASRNGIDAGNLFIDSIKPSASLLGFSAQGAASGELSGQQRVAGIIELMPKLAEDIDPIVNEIAEINKDLSKINPNRYPRVLGGVNVREALNQVTELSNGLAESAPRFKEILTTLPSQLGSDKPMTYLVLFQNDKELRSTGGFWTAYAIIKLNKGEIVDMTSGDMYFLDIDNRVAFYPPAPYPIATYLKLEDWYIRDVNIYADFEEAVNKMGEFWARVPGVPNYDAVVAIDTFVVEDLLGVLGPVELGGYGQFTKDNVTYQLELVSNVLKKNEGDRKDILGGLMREIVNRAFGLPANEYDKLISLAAENLSEKHILLNFKNSKAQALAEEFNMAGKINTTWEGDYLHINDTNLAGRKANWWIKEVVTKKTDKNGKTVLTIEYTNEGDYHSEWNTGYRDWVRVYVPKGSTLINSTGSLNPVQIKEEYGKTYFEGYMAVDPKQSVTLSLEYQIPQSTNLEKLLVQKQPGTPNFEYSISLGSNTLTHPLEKDIELEF